MNRLYLIIFIFLGHSLIKVCSQVNEDKFDYQIYPFKEITLFPKIKDTSNFIEKLKRNCHLYYQNKSILGETINYFKKIKIFGGDSEYYLLEYDFHNGANVQFPWKKQFIFDLNGKLIKILSEIRLDVVKIFPNQSPFLFGVSSTPHGNGWHEIYKIKSGGLAQIYNGFLGRRPQTYCRGGDNAINIPIEFNHKFMDINNDGFNDIIFYGKLLYTKVDMGVQDKTIPVKFVFLYNPKTGHFSEFEDYSKKYKFIFGDTK
jgi:hypothetical protein